MRVPRTLLERDAERRPARGEDRQLRAFPEASRPASLREASARSCRARVADFGSQERPELLRPDVARSRRCSARAMALATRSASAIDASETKYTPSSNAQARSEASCRASRVLPTPPDPSTSGAGPSMPRAARRCARAPFASDQGRYRPRQTDVGTSLHGDLSPKGLVEPSCQPTSTSPRPEERQVVVSAHTPGMRPRVAVTPRGSSAC